MFKNTFDFLLYDLCVGTRQVSNASPNNDHRFWGKMLCYTMPHMRWMLVQIKPSECHLKPGLVLEPEAT